MSGECWKVDKLLGWDGDGCVQTSLTTTGYLCEVLPNKTKLAPGLPVR